MIIVLALVSGLGCEVDVESPATQGSSAPVREIETVFEAEDLGQDLAVTSTQCAAKGIRQGDGSACQWCNCGLASAAMLRYVMTCGSENYSGATMRTYYNREYGLTGCGSGNAGSTCGSDPGRVASLMEVIHTFDGGPNYASTTYNHAWSELDLATFKTRLGTGTGGGYSAIVNGGGEGFPAAPCGFTGGHSIFVHNWDGTYFTVYDPECSDTSPRKWTAAQLDNWSWGGAGFVSCTLGKGAQATSNSRWKTIRHPDLNGDGHSDICGKDATGLRCALSNGSSAFGAATIWTPNAFMDADGWNLAYYRDTIQYADLNGDGKEDVCGRHGGGLYCALSTGTTFGTPTLWTSAYSNNAYWEEHEYYWRTIQLADVTGDGRADVCARSANGITCNASTGTAFGGTVLWTSSYSDANGWTASPSNWRTLQFIDLNGDGRKDICGRWSGGVSCALSTGSGFESPYLWTSDYANAGGWDDSEYYWGTIRFPDLNGDGRSDICGRSASGLYCGLSTGTSFLPSEHWTTAYSNAGNWNTHKSYWGTIQYGDLNGDGKDDVCGRHSAGLYCALSTGSAFNTTTSWTSNFSNTDGWNVNESNWGTLRLPRTLNGGLRADLCGRSESGIYCMTSTGTSFGTTLTAWSTQYSTANGWN
jgi:hypothetical protein